MGVFRRATITPARVDHIADRAPTRQWGASAGAHMHVHGASRSDDPENRVGRDGHLVATEGTPLQVPVTYRDWDRQQEAAVLAQGTG